MGICKNRATGLNTPWHNRTLATWERQSPDVRLARRPSGDWRSQAISLKFFAHLKAFHEETNIKTAQRLSVRLNTFASVKSRNNSGSSSFCLTDISSMSSARSEATAFL